MTDYLEALLALLEEQEEDRETPKLREELAQFQGGARTGSKVRKEERSMAEERPAGSGDGEILSHSGKSGAERSTAPLRGETAVENFALLRREAAERRPKGDALFRALEKAASALEQRSGTNRKTEDADTSERGAVHSGTDGRKAEKRGTAGGEKSSSRTAVVWSGEDSPGKRTAAEEQSAARAAAERQERTAVRVLERQVAAGLDRRGTVPRAVGGGPAGMGEEVLSLEELDRQVRRDARRYDGALSLY